MSKFKIISIPKTCPSCNAPTIIKSDNGRKTLHCSNENCIARLHDKMSNFCSREGMNIVGLSEERLRMFMELGYITDFESVYNLYMHKDSLEKIEGLGKSSVANLLKSIDESNQCKLSNVITAIGIPGIGKSSAKALAKHCALNKSGLILNTFVELAISNYDWTQLEDFGEITSNNINAFIRERIDEIKPLVDILKVLEDDEQSAAVNKLFGASFCITGKLEHFSNRDALVEEIEKYGGKIVSGVTAKTNYLITNDKESGSSKNQKAIKFGTKIISEQEFIDLCK